MAVQHIKNFHVGCSMSYDFQDVIKSWPEILSVAINALMELDRERTANIVSQAVYPDVCTKLVDNSQSLE